MSSIRLEKVCKTFPGSILAVNHLSMNIQDKELLVLTGPSGCGKSTLMRLIAGLEETSDGNIFIDEQLSNQIDPTERNIATINQKFTLYPHMNISGNLELGLRYRNLNGKEIKERVIDIARKLDIDNLLDKNPKSLDIFERQRVAFAKAAVKFPKALLVEQLNNGYNENTKKRLYDDIVELYKKLQVTTVLAIDSEVMPIISTGYRTAIMNKGLIEQIGVYDELYNKPVNKFVAGYIGRGYTTFISVKVYENEHNVYLDTDNKKLLLNKEKAEILKKGNYIDKEIVLALRSENMSIYDQSENMNILDTEIVNIEAAEQETILNLITDNFNLFVKTPRDLNYEIGDDVRVIINTSDVLLFNKLTGQIITE